MGRRISIAKLITVPAGTSGEEVIYTVEAAKRLKIDSVRINWGSGSAFELQITIMLGIEQIAPTEGFYAGDGGNTEDKISVEASSGDRIIVHYKNTGTTEHKALVIVRGELLD